MPDVSQNKSELTSWLIAMLAMEAAFDLAGVVAARSTTPT